MIGPLTDLPANLYVRIGPPGCGKTTFIAKKVMEAVGARGAGSVLVVSLTKAAAHEAAGRVPLPKDRVGTLHAHAYRALGCPTVAEEKVADWNAENPQWRLSGNDRSSLDEVPEERRRRRDAAGVFFTGGDDLYEDYCLCRARMVPREKWSGQTRRFAEGDPKDPGKGKAVLGWEEWKDDGGLVDYQDMIDRAREEVRHAPGSPELIWADEAQDFSAAEFDLLLRWAREAEALICLGDFDQSLYSWRGADPWILERLKVPDERRRVLEQSYRVPKTVHAAAVRWIEQIPGRRKVVYYPRPEDGEVVHAPSTWTTAWPEPVVDEAERLSESGKTVMILAACGYMLDATVAVLRKRGLPFHNPWRVRNGAWNPLRGAARALEFLRPDPGTWGEHARPWTWAEANKWIEILSAEKAGLSRGAKVFSAQSAKDSMVKDIQLDQQTLIDLFDDQEVGARLADAVGLSGGDVDAPAALRWLLSAALQSKRRLVEYPLRVVERGGGSVLRDRPRISVGTIHSTKGAESDVVMLFPDLSAAGAEAWSRGGEDRNSVVRQFYVGMTRAREKLVVCAQSGRDAVPI